VAVTVWVVWWSKSVLMQKFLPRRTIPSEPPGRLECLLQMYLKN